MKNEQTLLQRLQEIGTYAALLATIIGPIAAVLGFSLNEKLLYSLLALTLIPIAYLAHQYKKAARKIEEDGVVQRPQWLWRLLTHKLTHMPEQLVKGTVMVVVPPNVREEAKTLKDIHNQNDHFNLLFHYLPLPNPSDGRIDENNAESTLNERKRSLDIFDSQLEDCAGIVLLDDGDWKRYEKIYPQTWKSINDWSNKYTFRPVMSIRIQGEGTLKYSWCNLKDTLLNNQALLSNLLALAADRGKGWYSLATTQRQFSLIVVLTLVTALIISLSTNYVFINRIEQLKKEGDSRVEQLKNETPKLTNVVTTSSAEQTSLTEHFYSFRSLPVPDTEQVKFEQLLNGVVTQLKNKIIESSGVPSRAEVIMFALKNDSTNTDKYIIDEVAATRLPLRKFGFQFNLKEKDSETIVSCALARRAFVHWVAVDQSQKETKDIQVWNLNGDVIGAFNGTDKQWEYDGKTCKYGQPPKSAKDENMPDDPHQYLLCAPVGISNNPWVRPAGAICISSVADLKLNESWARQLLLNYGNLLSFFNWESALRKSQK